MVVRFGWKGGTPATYKGGGTRPVLQFRHRLGTSVPLGSSDLERPNTRLERSTAPVYQSEGYHIVSADCRSSAHR
jgi:hypothetical protein